MVVLLSGGIDSLVCAELARNREELVGCVFVDYGHPAQVQEGWKAFEYCGRRLVPLKVIGCNAADLADYADCRPPFLERIAGALGMLIETPLIGKSKAQVVELAIELGFKFDDAWSCYGAGPMHCGHCPSCLQADDAWREVGGDSLR